MKTCPLCGKEFAEEDVGYNDEICLDCSMMIDKSFETGICQWCGAPKAECACGHMGIEGWELQQVVFSDDGARMAFKNDDGEWQLCTIQSNAEGLEEDEMAYTLVIKTTIDEVVERWLDGD